MAFGIKRKGDCDDGRRTVVLWRDGCRKRCIVVPYSVHYCISKAKTKKIKTVERQRVVYGL